MRNYLARKNDGWGFDLFNDVFDGFFNPSIYTSRNESMRTDIKQVDGGYELAVDMPGFDKKDISVNLEDGYLTVSASKNEKEEDKHNYLRRERSFSCSRSYYVGEGVTEEDVKAKYNNGILTLNVPNKEVKKLPHRNIEID